MDVNGIPRILLSTRAKKAKGCCLCVLFPGDSLRDNADGLLYEKGRIRQLQASRLTVTAAATVGG